LSVIRALVLAGQLLHHPMSRFRAARLGGPQFLGWDDNTYLLADVRDSMLAIALGLSDTPSDFTPYPRPESELEQPEDGGTIADFDVAGFMRKLAT
jgi:hypothetical protein